MRRLFAALFVALAVGLFPFSVEVEAQSAVRQTWNSSIMYYNPTNSAGSMQLSIMRTDGSTPWTYDINSIDAHGSGELLVGQVATSPDFAGSGSVASNIPLLLVYEQMAGGSDQNYSRLLYTGFQAGQAGSQVFIPTFVSEPSSYLTRVAVQNISTYQSDLTLRFIDAAGAQVAELEYAGLPGSSSYQFTGQDLAGLPLPFNGSLVVEASGQGRLAAAVEELQQLGRRAYAYEGVSFPSTTVLMPSFLCRYSTGAQTSYYAIQNAGEQPTRVSVQAFNEKTGKAIGTYTFNSPIPPGGKVSFNACLIRGAASKSGTALVSSLDGQPLAVVGKVSSTDGLMTSFTGHSGGSTRAALPYVLWSTSAYKGYRTYLSVMNAGTQPATAVTLRFYNSNGSLAASLDLATPARPLAAYNKRSTTPQAARALQANGSFRGAVEVVSDQPVVMIARLERKITGVRGYRTLGEDYTALSVSE